ncbi:cryptococcal mannosyltransferase 1-domain-containing protein [Vararia minispora EC-137]|uniref:Cryptococcal mannosyltransferase 1-domain-containing protein n=1 Tax=Vararia minispora EC-137 TaxID=1314806 RepID=A0ACB8QUL0_9AGAM|nr:cryptococcal mannosyltransferase 1-domain-containing protein [Vararia minispora EC-137]
MAAEKARLALTNILHSKRYLTILATAIACFLVFTWQAPLVADNVPRLDKYFKPTSISGFQRRAYKLSDERARPTCVRQRFHESRYKVLEENPRAVFIAINFYQNQEVIPTFFQEFPGIVERLGRKRVYVSIYENGSEDKSQQLLRLFDDMLTYMGVPHRVITRGRDEYSHKENGHRINVLAAIRNAAMEPLYSGEAARQVQGGMFDDVLWINDVYHCQADILEVLYQKRLQGANQACAVDWAGWGDHVIYDRWVLRTITGKVFYIWEELVRWMYPTDDDPREPDGRGPLPRLLPYDEADRRRFEAHLPIQVFSCWNGATAIDASAFLEPNNLRFRIAKADLDEGGRPKEVTEMVSECFLSSVDLWKMGKGKVALAPRASVAYNTWNYNTHRKDQLPLPSNSSDEVITNWVRDPPETVAFQDNAAWNAPERWAPWDEQ